MVSPIILSIFKLKNFLNEKGLLARWQYLIIAASLSFFAGLSWALIALKLNTELGVIAALIGLVQGFLAFFYMQRKGDPALIVYAAIFGLFSYFLGKYLVFVHYFDWTLSAFIDKEVIDFSLLIFYVKMMNYDSIGQFISFYKMGISLYDLLWILIILSSSLEYIYFYSSADNSKGEGQNSSGSSRRIKRRFTGQKY